MNKIELIGNGNMEVAPNQQFVDKSGRLIRIIRGEDQKPIEVPLGRAYGFIECYAPKADIQRSLAEAIPIVRSPGGPKHLELTITE